MVVSLTGNADLLTEELQSARTNIVEVETQAAQYRAEVLADGHNYQTMNSF